MTRKVGNRKFQVDIKVKDQHSYKVTCTNITGMVHDIVLGIGCIIGFTIAMALASAIVDRYSITGVSIISVVMMTIVVFISYMLREYGSSERERKNETFCSGTDVNSEQIEKNITNLLNKFNEELDEKGQQETAEAEYRENLEHVLEEMKKKKRKY